MQSRGGGGKSLEPRTAIAGSFSAWGGLGGLDRGLGHGEPFFSDSDSDEAFQISRKLGLVHVEFFCVLIQQLCLELRRRINSDVTIYHVACKFPGFFHKAPTQYRYWETIVDFK
jgi:hypothetical protein